MLENNNFHAFYSLRQQATSDEVWHRRIGHPNPQVLHRLASSKAIHINKVSKKMCEAYQLGKSYRLLFSSSSFVSSRPLERVHCDIW